MATGGRADRQGLCLPRTWSCCNAGAARSGRAAAGRDVRGVRVVVLERLVKPNPETRRKYLERLRVHVFPVIGERPIVEITRREMRLWQEGLLAKGSSPKTIQNIRGETVSPIFEAACLPGEDDEPPLRTYNPLKGLKLPERNRPEREPLLKSAGLPSHRPLKLLNPPSR